MESDLYHVTRGCQVEKVCVVVFGGEFLLRLSWQVTKNNVHPKQNEWIRPLSLGTRNQ